MLCLVEDTKRFVPIVRLKVWAHLVQALVSFNHPVRHAMLLIPLFNHYCMRLLICLFPEILSIGSED